MLYTRQSWEIVLKKLSFLKEMSVEDAGPTLVAAVLAGLWFTAMLHWGFNPLQLLSLAPGDRFIILGLIGWACIAMLSLTIGLAIWTVSDRLKISRLADTR